MWRKRTLSAIVRREPLLLWCVDSFTQRCVSERPCELLADLMLKLLWILVEKVQPGFDDEFRNGLIQHIHSSIHCATGPSCRISA